MQGFEPIFCKDSKVLILGSFPSVKSREISFYYGNKLNRFWRMIEDLYGVKLNSTDDKINCILQNKLALWDICKACDIEGSLDSNIKNVEFVDLRRVLPPHSNVKKILCNGRKSYDLTNKYLRQNFIDIEVKYLPSTSPANTKFLQEEWEKELFDIKSN